MQKEQWYIYVDRLEDLGEQILDLAAELRADPPDGWARPGLMGIPILGSVHDVPTVRGVQDG